MQISTTTLKNGYKLICIPDDRFASVQVKFWYSLPLQKEHVTSGVMLSQVLKRGSQNYPTSLVLTKALDQLWGASLDFEAQKLGSRHLIMPQIEFTDPRFLPEKATPIIKEAISLLEDIVNQPLASDMAFDSKIFQEEQAVLRAHQERIRNYPQALAMINCQALLFSGEAQAVPRLGLREDLDSLTPQSLYEYYRYFQEEAELTIGITGAITPHEAEQLLEQILPPQKKSPIIAPLEAKNWSDEPLRKIDTFETEQSQLIIAFTSGLSYGDELSLPLTLVNGLWGGFAHSRLFRKVREEAGLAYATWTNCDRYTGVIYAAAGLNAQAAKGAEEIILRELAEIQKGNFTESELAMTKKTLLDTYRISMDDPAAMLLYNYSGTLWPRPYDLVTTMQQIADMTPDMICAAAKCLKPAVSYLLKNADDELTEDLNDE